MTLSFINKRSFGFSLFEILAAVLVLSLMIFSSYIFIPPKFAQSRDARRKSDLNRIKKALMEYYDVSGTFPETMNNCNLPLIVDKAVVLDRIPCDPSKKTPYFIEINLSENWFKAYTNLENLKDSDIIYFRCQQGCGPECAYNYGVSSPNTKIDTCMPPPLLYACSPGGGGEGDCEQYDNPYLSECPQVFMEDPTCQNLCGDNRFRCKDSSGKHVPE